MNRKARKALLVVYELVILVLLVASTGWRLERIGIETIILVVLLFIPVILPRIASLQLPIFGGSATVKFQQLQASIEGEAQRVDEIANGLAAVTNSLTAYALSPQLQEDSYRRHVDSRVEGEKTLIVGCQQSSEQYLLCAILSILLKEKTGFVTVVPKFDYSGGPALNMLSLLRGQIDVYPCYTWVGFEMSIGPSLKYVAPPLKTLSVEACVNQLNMIYSKSPVPLRWLHPLGFEDSWAIFMLRQEAERMKIKKLSDLLLWDGKLTFGCEYEFFGRESAYGALQLSEPYGYGIRFKEVKFYRFAEIYEALLKGEVDMIDGFTTDPEPTSFLFTHIEDDRNHFGKYMAVIVARGQLIDQHPEIEEALRVLRDKIDGTTMMEMIEKANRVREGHHEAIQRIALEFLYKNHFLEK